MRLFPARVVQRTSLLDAAVVRFPLNLGLGWKCEHTLQRLPRKFISSSPGFRSKSLPDSQDSPAIIACPDAQDVLAVAYAEDRSTHLITRLGKLVANQGKQQILPEPIGHAFLESYNPLSPLAVVIILPYGSDALFENMVIGHKRQRRRSLEMSVKGEEILRRLHTRHGMYRLFILDISIGFGLRGSKPEDPAMSERMPRQCPRFRGS